MTIALFSIHPTIINSKAENVIIRVSLFTFFVEKNLECHWRECYENRNTTLEEEFVGKNVIFNVCNSIAIHIVLLRLWIEKWKYSICKKFHCNRLIWTFYSFEDCKSKKFMASNILGFFHHQWTTLNQRLKTRKKSNFISAF